VVEMMNYFGRASNADYSIITQIVLFMGLARVIDLGTGINSQIIATSNFWKFDFYTNILYTLIALPLNFILIKKFGILGLAYANLISLSVYNLVRYAFLYYKFGLQPYTTKSLLTLVIAAISFFIAWLIPLDLHWLISIIIRTSVFCVFFIPLIYFSNVAPEIKDVTNKMLMNLRNVLRK
jgi:O-antigen/teichoic acid export membrane protein